MPGELEQIDDVRSFCSFSAQNNFPYFPNRHLLPDPDCPPAWNQRSDIANSGIDASRTLSASQMMLEAWQG